MISAFTIPERALQRVISDLTRALRLKTMAYVTCSESVIEQLHEFLQANGYRTSVDKFGITVYR